MSDHPIWQDLPLFPVQASDAAGRVDALFFFLIALTLFFSALIAGMLIVFGIRFRSRGGARRAVPIHGSLVLELTWTLIPLAIVMFVFLWGADLYLGFARPPDDVMDVRVVGKQWMWKLQHPNGKREINELHVPVGRAVRLTMTSEDVIHSFFVPAFRVKADAVPGRYTALWFRPTRPGRYHLFCTEYCGTKHSGMIGWVHVQEPAEFQAWLTGGGPGVSVAAAGERLFRNLGCATCHVETATGRGPSLRDVFQSQVKLAGGGTAIADEAYLRESILDPGSKLVDGYQPVMPTFRGLVNEEGILQIIEYLKSLREQAGGVESAGGAGGGGAGGEERRS